MAKRRQRGAGTVRQLPSGRWQARLRGEDGVRVSASTTFDTKLDASAWLKAQTDDIDRGVWQTPVLQKVPALRDYAATWLANRDLKPRTRAHYRSLLDVHIVPALGDVALDRVSPTTVRNWYADLDPAKPTTRAHAYGLLRAIFATAFSDDLVTASPCRIRGGSATKTRHEPRIASLAELDLIVAAMPTRYRPLVLLAAWCGLRFGELAELRRGDVDLDAGLLRIQRGVARANGEVFIGGPKTSAGRRSVSIPPHLLPVLVDHLRAEVGADPGALVFPARNGGNLAPTSLHKVWRRAREQAGRPDLHFHDLRHTGATLAAATGATLADLMARIGHSTPGAAMRYQHAASDRDAAIAAALSGFADAKVVSLRRRATS